MNECASMWASVLFCKHLYTYRKICLAFLSNVFLLKLTCIHMYPCLCAESCMLTEYVSGLYISVGIDWYIFFLIDIIWLDQLIMALRFCGELTVLSVSSLVSLTFFQFHCRFVKCYRVVMQIKCCNLWLENKDKTRLCKWAKVGRTEFSLCVLQHDDKWVCCRHKSKDTEVGCRRLQNWHFSTPVVRATKAKQLHLGEQSSAFRVVHFSSD